MTFYKLQATGNDFIFFIDIDEKVDVKQLCDRRKGIGADGVIIIDSLYNVTIYNADGSLANMCGNGLRCACKLINSLTNKTNINFYINNHVIETKMVDEDTSYVLMPTPMMINYDNGYLVSLLNKHFILFTNNIDTFIFDESLIKLSNEKQCNISVIQIINRRQIKIRTYEYGVKETLSCGSASLASFFVCFMLDKVESNIQVINNGGVLSCFNKNNKYYLQGKVNYIYKGELQ